MDYSSYLELIKSFLVSVGLKILAALLVYLIGKYIIKKITKFFANSNVAFGKNKTVSLFVGSLLKYALYILLFITVISILGVPMASIVAVVASAAAAVGLALQGSLSNFAGGIMILIFKPFKVGDFIKADDVSGSVKSINTFYTIITTPDNKVVNIPNGSLMNTVVINYSSEKLRRVDIALKTSKDENVANVLTLLNEAVEKLDNIEKTKDMFIGFEGMDEESYNFIIKVWTKNDKYWDLYYDIQKAVNDVVIKNNIKSPYKRISNI